ncbi:MAG TPA: GlsB/YeaQ/YmgE family stress response membrane protein [Blastocatellia bacterium]|nr:GlsB/YeaQ/YmgE family stress response membrane protein [Blastocatellia bacterium]
MFSLLWTIIIGLIVGIIAKVIMPGRDPGGFIMTTILGIAGSFIGTFVGRMFFGRYYSAGFIMSILGAIALLAIYRMITGQRTT